MKHRSTDLTGPLKGEKMVVFLHLAHLRCNVREEGGCPRDEREATQARNVFLDGTTFRTPSSNARLGNTKQQGDCPGCVFCYQSQPGCGLLAPLAPNSDCSPVRLRRLLAHASSARKQASSIVALQPRRVEKLNACSPPLHDKPKPSKSVACLA